MTHIKSILPPAVIGVDLMSWVIIKDLEGMQHHRGWSWILRLLSIDNII